MHFVRSDVVFNGCTLPPLETISTENYRIGGQSSSMKEALNVSGFLTERSKINTRINWGKKIRF